MKFTSKKVAFTAQKELWEKDKTNYSLLTIENDDDTVRYELVQAKSTERFVSAILIDVEDGEFYPCRVSTDSYKSICKMIGVDSIDAVCIGDEKRACVYVDDEGLYKEGNKPFYIHNSELLGSALVVGTNTDGSDADCPLTLDELKEIVSLVRPANIVTEMKEYLMTYIEEKGISVGHIFHYDVNGTSVMMPLSSIIDMVSDFVEYHEDIKKQIAMIEFKNADPLHFFEFMGRHFAETSVQGNALFADESQESSVGARP